MSTQPEGVSPEVPWHAAYPEPRNKDPKAISRSELLQELKKGKKHGTDFLLIDLRRMDHEGGAIKGSLNLPAHTIYNSLPTLCDLSINAGIKKIIFFCGSSRGRGTRAAGWFDDLLSDRDITSIESMILSGGIKGWANAGDEYTQLMDEYDPKPWEKFK